MNFPHSRRMGGIALGALLALGQPALAEDKSHDHAHEHEHAHDADSKRIYDGYFEDHEIQTRSLEDWQGDWQSVYPLLTDGTLAPVMEHKAESGSKTAEEYAAYYEIGYKTDVDRIEISGDVFTFHSGDQAISGHYASDGYEVLTYAKGNRGVRYIFEKIEGDAEAPQFVQFSDHAVAPTDAGHFHLYWGDDRAALLEEVTNWPTYYPAELSGVEIVDEMISH